MSVIGADSRAVANRLVTTADARSFAQGAFRRGQGLPRDSSTRFFGRDQRDIPTPARLPLGCDIKAREFAGQIEGGAQEGARRRSTEEVPGRGA
jgi:hypothetical protein